MTDRASIELRGVSKTFLEGDRRRAVLRGIDLDIERGETVALLGASGSGKSTLLDLIGGLELPDAGTIRVLGEDWGRLGERERTRLRRRHIGFVFQAFHLIPTLTVLENVLLAPDLDGRATESATDEAHGLLERLGLGDRHASFPDRLSGGERQRVALARALVLRPELVLADEPTGNLDGGSANRVLDALFELTAETGGTLVVVTHSERVAGRCGRVLHMDSLQGEPA